MYDFQFEATVAKTVVNFQYGAFYSHISSFLAGKHPGMGLFAHNVDMCYALEKSHFLFNCLHGGIPQGTVLSSLRRKLT